MSPSLKRWSLDCQFKLHSRFFYSEGLKSVKHSNLTLKTLTAMASLDVIAARAFGSRNVRKDLRVVSIFKLLMTVLQLYK